MLEKRALAEELRKVSTSLEAGEKERNSLLRSLARLNEEVLSHRNNGPDSAEVSPHTSFGALAANQKSTIASQTDLSAEVVLTQLLYNYCSPFLFDVLTYVQSKRICFRFYHRLVFVWQSWHAPDCNLKRVDDICTICRNSWPCSRNK